MKVMHRDGSPNDTEMEANDEGPCAANQDMGRQDTEECRHDFRKWYFMRYDQEYGRIPRENLFCVWCVVRMI